MPFFELVSVPLINVKEKQLKNLIITKYKYEDKVTLFLKKDLNKPNFLILLHQPYSMFRKNMHDMVESQCDLVNGCMVGKIVIEFNLICRL